MNTQLRNFTLLIAVLAASAWAAPALHAQEAGARVQIILVEAGNPGTAASGGEAKVDGALRPYAATLQRLFRFQSYRQVAKRGLSLKVPGEGSINLAEGQALTLRASGQKGGGLMADLVWTRGSQRLLHTRIQLRPGQPAVLGGPSSGRDGGNYLLILEME